MYCNEIKSCPYCGAGIPKKKVMDQNIAVCKICGKTYKVYALNDWYQSICPECNHRIENNKATYKE